MSKKNLILTLAMFFFAITSLGQNNPNIKRTLNWRFGTYVGANFNLQTQEVSFLPYYSYWYSWEAASSISDMDGNLLFYTDGESVFNRNDVLMAGIDISNYFSLLYGHPSAIQGALIVPQPGNDNIYYVFTCEAWEEHFLYNYHRGLRYSIININGDGGLGELVEKNILLQNNVGESVVATSHQNETDYWIVSSTLSGMMYSYLLNENGISGPIDSLQSTNIFCLDINEAKHPQFLKFSPQGNLIFKGGVCTGHIDYTIHTLIGFNNSTGIFEFDHETDILESEIILEMTQDTTISLWPRATFSPAGNYLYVIKKMALHPFWLPSVIERYRIKYPIIEEDVIQSREIFFVSESKRFMKLQITPHGNIWVSQSTNSNLHAGQIINIIQNPNSEDFAYFEPDVYDLAEIYNSPYQTNLSYASVFWNFNNTVESWLFNDNEITTFRETTTKERRKNNLFYPNPSNGEIYLTNYFDNETHINIYSLTGTLLHKETIYSISVIKLSHLSGGVYIIEFTDNKQYREFSKIIIN